MKFVVTGVLMLLSFLAALNLRAPPTASPPRPAWDYCVMGGGPGGESLTPGDSLAKLGTDGWELVAVTEPTVNGVCRFYFKRPR